MKSYMKLVNFEINRFLKIYIALAVMTVIVQFSVVIIHTRSFMKRVREVISEGRGYTGSDSGIDPISIVDVMDDWYVIPIVICIATLLIYCLMIWYRDWFGKNTFIFRLLMLPTERINIYFAKATAIFLMVLGLVSLQLMLLPVENRLFQLMVPIDFRHDVTVSGMMIGFGQLNILFPSNVLALFNYYGIGFMAVFVLFTSILLERSYRLKGILFGIIYFVLALAIFMSPWIVIAFTETNYLYPVELFILEVILGLLVTAASCVLSHYLLKKKIRV